MFSRHQAKFFLHQISGLLYTQSWVQHHVSVLPYTTKAERKLSAFAIYLVKLKLFRNFFGLHVGINILHIVEIFEQAHHFVDSLALFRRNLFKIVGDICEFSSYHVKTVSLKILLNLSEALGVAINGNGIFFLVFIIFIINSEINQFENEFVHIQPVLFMEREYAFVVEQECQ